MHRDLNAVPVAGCMMVFVLLYIVACTASHSDCLVCIFYVPVAARDSAWRGRIVSGHVTHRKPPTVPAITSTIYRHFHNNVLSRTIIMLRTKD
jgi:hypothetical protein